MLHCAAAEYTVALIVLIGGIATVWIQTDFNLYINLVNHVNNHSDGFRCLVLSWFLSVLRLSLLICDTVYTVGIKQTWHQASALLKGLWARKQVWINVRPRLWFTVNLVHLTAALVSTQSSDLSPIRHIRSTYIKWRCLPCVWFLCLPPASVPVSRQTHSNVLESDIESPAAAGLLSRGQTKIKDIGQDRLTWSSVGYLSLPHGHRRLHTRAHVEWWYRAAAKRDKSRG